MLAFTDGALIHWEFDDIRAGARSQLLPDILAAWDKLKDPLSRIYQPCRSRISARILKLVWVGEVVVAKVMILGGDRYIGNITISNITISALPFISRFESVD